jgi:hypothetical protein
LEGTEAGGRISVISAAGPHAEKTTGENGLFNEVFASGHIKPSPIQKMPDFGPISTNHKFFQSLTFGRRWQKRAKSRP